MSATIVSKDNFQTEVLESSQPVLVDFWAEWCGPCRMLSPMVEQIAAENPELKVCKVNVDDEQELAEKFNVMSIPMLIAFKDGKVLNSTVGLQPKENILALFK